MQTPIILFYSVYPRFVMLVQCEEITHIIPGSGSHHYLLLSCHTEVAVVRHKYRSSDTVSTVVSRDKLSVMNGAGFNMQYGRGTTAKLGEK